ncbi:tRNA methyltransferase 10 [Bonamia ostreae]|uniref:tRNA (guanine(9)-N(1))-methyltransferase n=1 Tax=Bonamia ostreae TaxID=126728 RepID=A0ABV2AG97_9EUKA
MERLKANYVKSKNELKREQKYRNKVEFMQNKRRQKRILKKTNKKSNRRATPNEEQNNMKYTRRESLQLFRENVAKSRFNIVFDLSFNNLMPERKINSLVNQMLYCYAENKRNFESPAKMIWTSFGSSVEKFVEQKKIDLDKWMIEKDARHWKDIFRSEDIVYLSPDAEEVLGEIEEEKVYVIGGLVDNGHEKNLTLDIAKELGVSRKKFPVDQINKKNLVFTVNQTFEILVKVFRGESWRETIAEVFPKRKAKQ